MTSQHIKTIFLILGALILSFTIGRYSVKNEVITKTIEVETHENKEIRKHTETTTKKAPDGTTTTTTTTDTNTTSQKDQSKEIDTQKIIEAVKPKLNVSALMGYNRNNLHELIVGVHISKELLGPVSFGVWVTTEKSFGVSVGLGF